jgi:hypothetical protein
MSNTRFTRTHTRARTRAQTQANVASPTNASNVPMSASAHNSPMAPVASVAPTTTRDLQEELDSYTEFYDDVCRALYEEFAVDPYDYIDFVELLCNIWDRRNDAHGSYLNEEQRAHLRFNPTVNRRIHNLYEAFYCYRNEVVKAFGIPNYTEEDERDLYPGQDTISVRRKRGLPRPTSSSETPLKQPRNNTTPFVNSARTLNQYMEPEDMQPYRISDASRYDDWRTFDTREPLTPARSQIPINQSRNRLSLAQEITEQSSYPSQISRTDQGHISHPTTPYPS